jgi:hypothetical protein
VFLFFSAEKRGQCFFGFCFCLPWLKEAARNLKYAGAGGAGRYPIPLDNDFYAKENKHMGWNLLSESFVRYQLGLERQEGGRGAA